MSREISAELQIQSYFHCRKCLEEVENGTARLNEGGPVSPQSYRRYDIGWTVLGLQVWCTRHNINILHVDFEGQRHPANTHAHKGEDDAGTQTTN